MKTAGYFVGLLFKFTAGMQHGQDDFERGFPLQLGVLNVLHRVNRNAAAVIDHRHGVVGMERHIDVLGITREDFIDGVVDDLVDQMMQTLNSGRANVHRRPFADGFDSLEDLDG